MEEAKRLALISIIVENRTESEKLNAYLSEYGEYMVGRMGIPYQGKGVISVVVDAPPSAINALTGKIGKLNGVSAKTLYGKI